MHKSAVRALITTLLLVALLLTAAQVILSLGVLPPRTIDLKDIRHESGHAYVGAISTTAYSSHQGPSPAILYEDQVQLGPANCIHDDIRANGEGGYSVWHDTVYFSTSDNTNPLDNKRSYTLQAPWIGPLGRNIVYAAMWASWVALVIMALLSVRAGRAARKPRAEAGQSTIVPRLAEEPVGAARKVGFPNWLLIPISLILCLAVLEVFFRFVHQPPKGISLPSLPVVWDRDIGWHYEPGAECEYLVRLRDGSTVTTHHKANKWGFLDREIASERDPNALRIMVLGDSFVEALQVNMEEKFTALLADGLGKKLHKPVEIVAMGMSGTGQANQYAFWRKFRDQFKPQYLVLVMVDNDIRDNDPELSARYHRWNPVHPPRTYFMLSPDGPDGLAEMPISEKWQVHAALLRDPASDREADAGLAGLVRQWSKFGEFVLDRTAPEKGWPWNLTYKGHHIDLAYLAPELKNDPLIKESWSLSTKILAKFARECRETGTRLILMLAVPRSAGASGPKPYKWSIFYDWVARQAEADGVGLVSMPERLKSLGKRQEDVTVQDGHWDREGHIIAASLLEDFFLAQERPAK